MTQTLENVLAELRSKESELTLAARYGNALLEEKEQLRKKLQAAQEEVKELEEELQHERRKSQKELMQAKADADVIVIDLESKLSSEISNLEVEQNTHRATKEGHQRELDALLVENAKLQTKIQTLLDEKDKHSERVRKVSQSLKQSEAEGHDAFIQQEELLKKLERVELSNKSYSEERATLVLTCEQLTEQLQSTRIMYDTLEERYKQLQEEFDHQSQEMEDSQEMLKQLEAEKQRGTASSPTSTMSLHDELSFSMNSLDMIPEDTAWHPQHDSNSPQSGEDIDSPLSYEENIPSQMSIPFEDSYQSRASTIRRASEHSLESGLSTLRRTDRQEAVATWASSSDEGGLPPCSRCTDMQKMLTHYQQELSSANKLLLSAVSQKVKLQEQNDDWESDIAEMLHENIHHKLEKEPRRRKLCKPQDMDSTFKQDFIKHSWLF